MAQAFNKFNDFVEQLGLEQHQLNTDPLFVYLSDEAPIATDTTRADIADLATGGGYTAGGKDTTNTASENPAGTMKVVAVDLVWTATVDGFGPFRYAILYNQIGGLDPTNKLIGWWDYQSSISLAEDETFTVDFVSDTLLTIV